MKAKYNIGDQVFLAHIECKQNYTQCPDCFGNCYLTVILGNGDQVQVQCTECSRGMYPSSGKISKYNFEPEVIKVTIEGLEIEREGSVKYTHSSVGCSYRRNNEDELFLDENLAKLRAEELRQKKEEEENDRIKKKVKDHRSWAWNATYHRSVIRRAKKDLEYHTKMLEYAKFKAKEKTED